MKRTKKSVRVYRYGLLPPVENEVAIRDQMRKAHAYRNVLIEIERGRRAAERDLLSGCGDVAALEAAASESTKAEETAARAVTAARSSSRKRDEPKGLKDALKVAREAKRDALTALKAYRDKVREDAAVAPYLEAARGGVRTGVGIIDRYLAATIATDDVEGGPNSDERAAARDERAAAAYAVQESDVEHAIRVAIVKHALSARAAWLKRAARAASGLFSGTYQFVEGAADDAARKMPLYDGVEPNDPCFVRWTGDGAVAVQIDNGGVPCADIFGNDTRLRVDPVDEGTWWALRQRDVVLTVDERRLRADLPPIGWGSTLPPEERVTRWRTRPALERERDPRPRDPEDQRVPGRRGPHTMLRMRVGSDGRAAIWGVWPMIMHRGLPEGGTIKRATVHVRQLAGTTNRGHGTVRREEWYVTITVQLPDVADAPRVRRCGEGAIAVDLGWRQVGEENRVAAWHGEDGRADELRLDARVLTGLRKADEIRSIRDQNFNSARGVLATWLREHEDVPDWLREATRFLGQWKASAKLAMLALRWRDARFPGDDEAFGRRPTADEIRSGVRGAGIEGWRHQDKHLWEWEESQRTGALRHRREVYRRFAADIARGYRTLVIEDFDLSKMAKRAPRGGAAENETARSNRHAVATSELRICMINAFRDRGGAEEKVPARDTTRTCNVCGLVETFDAAAMIHHACTGCSAVWDQDDNAAINMLARWDKLRRERSADAQNPGAARNEQKPNGSGAVKRSRWARARRLAPEREARKGTAREAVDNAAE